MSETSNIARMAQILSDDVFGEFFWTKVGPADTNWPCENGEVHKCSTHPTDVVFYYDNPYTLSRTYVNCDLKSYSKNTINKSKITPSIESLARTVSCAEKSSTWQKRFLHEHVNHEVCGLLFVYNHDGGYDRDFRGLVADAEPNPSALPKQSKLFVLGPEDIFWLNNVRYEIVQMRGKGVIPAREDCQFFYPNLVRRNNVQPVHARAATLEMLTSPWIVLKFNDPKSKKEGYVVFYRRAGDSVPEFLYFIDYLMYYQILQPNTEIHLRTLQAAADAAASFQKAAQEYTEQCENSSEIRERLKAISYSQISQVHVDFSQIEIGMDNG